MSDGKSYRQILRSTSIIGGASVLNIFIGLVRIKVAALVLGPAGVGLIGLFNNLINTASSVAALGVGTVGTRQIAEAVGRDDANAVAVARRAMLWGTLVLAGVGTSIFWLLRGVLATHVLADPSLTTDVGWLAIGVGLTVIAASQSALLNGLRRIGDLARVSVYSALLSTALGVGALLLWREKGLLIFLLLAPMARFVVGQVYLVRLPKVKMPAPRLSELTEQWHVLGRLGFAFMLAGLAGTVGQLVVRSMVQRELGVDALGHFEAAWVISMTYIGFVLSAMGTDYYPRLTAVIHDPEAVNRLVNEQTEVALLLAGPVFLIVLGLAPWVIDLLYSTRFAESSEVLRWQILGDVLKVVSWPLGFMLLAAGDGRAFLITECIGFGVFTIFTWLGLSWLGVQATGIAFLAMYIVYLPMVYWVAWYRVGFRWTTEILWQVGLLFGACVSIKILTIWKPILGAAISLLLALCWAIYAVSHLSRMNVTNGPITRLINRLFRAHG